MLKETLRFLGLEVERSDVRVAPGPGEDVGGAFCLVDVDVGVVVVEEAQRRRAELVGGAFRGELAGRRERVRVEGPELGSAYNFLGKEGKVARVEAGLARFGSGKDPHGCGSATPQSVSNWWMARIVSRE